jgi:flagellar motor switch protein FliM
VSAEEADEQDTGGTQAVEAQAVSEAQAAPEAQAAAAEAVELDSVQAQRTTTQTVEEDAHEPHIDAHGRARRIRTLDFSQPTKFTADFRRRIARVLGPFCEAVANRLSAELRTPVELQVSDSSQLTWSAARAQLPAQSVSVALHVRPIDRQMLLDIELPIILQSLECLLGGSAAQASSERRLSEIDWALARGLLDSIVAQLALAWRDLGNLELVPGEIDLEGDAGVFAPIGEPTFALALECRIDGLASRISLLIPWSAIEPVAGELLTEERLSDSADPHEEQAVQSGLAGVEVLVRAEIGSVLMPVERILALTPGTMLTLQDRAEDGVQLFAEGVPLGFGRPGLRGARRAIKLTSMSPPTGGAPGSAARTGFGRGDLARAGGADCAPGEARRQLAALERMLGVPVRVWGELGRTRMGLGCALELPTGAVVELDQSGEDPIELFVNGMRFATGSLLVSSDGEWAVQVAQLI